MRLVDTQLALPSFDQPVEVQVSVCHSQLFVPASVLPFFWRHDTHHGTHVSMVTSIAGCTLGFFSRHLAWLPAASSLAVRETPKHGPWGTKGCICTLCRLMAWCAEHQATARHV
jgi:hypothetical protein